MGSSKGLLQIRKEAHKQLLYERKETPMKTYRKFYVTLLAAALCVAMAVPAFAVSFSKKTDHYGTLTGDSHKYQNYLYTTTAVTTGRFIPTLR